MPHLGGYNFGYDIGNTAHKIRRILNPHYVEKALHLLSFEHDETASCEVSVNVYHFTRHDIHRAVVLWYICDVGIGVTESAFGRKFIFISKL